MADTQFPSYWEGMDHELLGADSPHLTSARWILHAAETKGWNFPCPLRDFDSIFIYAFHDGPDMKKGKPGVSSVRLLRKKRVVDIVLNYTYEEMHRKTWRECLDNLLRLTRAGVERASSLLMAEDPKGAAALLAHRNLVERRALALPGQGDPPFRGRTLREMGAEAALYLERKGLGANSRT